MGYSWNARGQLSGVTSLAGEFTYEYDPSNPALLTKMTGPAHIVETTYEPHRNLITSVTNRRKGAGIQNPGASGSTPPPAAAGTPIPAPDSQLLTPISSYSYVNDLLGRRETISQGGEAFALLKLGDTKIDVAYNDRSEVVGAVYKTGNETRQQFSYDYDAIGNRRSFASEVRSRNSEVRREETSYKTNALNQYEAISADQRRLAVQPSCDLDGNLAEDDKNRYTWDSENRLIRVESKDGKTKVEYAYDYQSRRTVRREYRRTAENSDFQILNSVFYLYDGWNLLAEVEETRGQEPSATNHALRAYTWGQDLSGTLQGAGGVGGLLAVTQTGRNAEDSSSWIPSSRFFLFDANGNVSQVLNDSGAITAAYTYDPFGNVTEMAGPEAEANPWRFSTKPVDAGTGWLYYGYRYYSPESGRWASRDPIEESGGLNLYGFVRNDAQNFIDSFGLIEIDFEDMNTDPGFSWGMPRNPAWIGWTSYNETVSCGPCEKCETCKCWTFSCSISVTPTITLNRDYFGSWRMNEVYGHEQAHILSRNSSINALVTGYGMISQEKFSHGGCSDERADFERDLMADVQTLLKLDDHTGGAASTPDSPPAGTPIPPLPGTTNGPPDLPFSLFKASRR